MGTGNKGKRRGLKAVKPDASPKKSLQNVQPQVDNNGADSPEPSSDLGQLRVGVHEKAVIFEFGGSVARMPPDAAKRFAKALWDSAAQAEGNALIVRPDGRPAV